MLFQVSKTLFSNNNDLSFDIKSIYQLDFTYYISERFQSNSYHFTESCLTLVLSCDVPCMPNSHNFSDFTRNHTEIYQHYTQNHEK